MISIEYFTCTIPTQRVEYILTLIFVKTFSNTHIYFNHHRIHKIQIT